MRHIRTLFFVMLAMVAVPLQAQTFEQELEKAEQFKAKHGDTSEKYLDALSKAIQMAFGAEDYETANKYRLVHMDAVKKKYGENSLAYAEDLWRLGNVSSYKGPDYTFDCYSQAAKIYENKNATKEFVYANLMQQLFLHYNGLKDIQNSLAYLQKTIAVSENWINKEWKGNTVAPEIYALYHFFLGDIYEFNLNDDIAASIAYERCASIVDSYVIEDSFSYSQQLYLALTALYGKIEQYDKQKVWGEKWASYIKKAHGEFSKEYIEAAGRIRTNYWAAGDYDGAIKAGKTYIDLVKRALTSINANPRTDSLYVYAVKDLCTLYGALRDYPNVIKTGEDLASMYKDVNMTGTSEYIGILDDLLNAYSKTGDYDKWFSIYDEYAEILRKYGLEKSEKYHEILQLKVENLMILYRFDEYEKAYNELVALTKELYGENSYQNLLLVYQTANRFAAVEKYPEAKKVLAGCNDILNSGNRLFDSKKDSLLVMSSIHQLEGSILQSENDSRAEDMLKLSIEEGKTTSWENKAAYTTLGCYYLLNAHRYNEALDNFQVARELIMQQGDTTSVNYYAVLNNIGMSYLSLGQYDLAINSFDEAAYKINKEHGKLHPSYAFTIQNKSLFYATITDYQSATKFGEDAQELIGQIYGTNSEKYAVALQNLGLYYAQLKKYDEAEKRLLSAVEIFRNMPSVQSIYLIYPYTNLLNVYGLQKNYEKFNEIDSICKAILVESNKQESMDAVMYYGTIGYILATNNSPDAKHYFAETIKIMEKLGEEGSMDYLNSVLYYALTCYIDGVPEDIVAKYLAEEYRKRYLSTFVYFNHEERESLISGERFQLFKNVLFSYPTDDTYNESLYDFILFNKGLLLGTSMSFAKAVYSSGDNSIVADYEQLVDINKALKGATVPNNSIQGKGDDELRKEASILERDITNRLKQNGDYLSDLDVRFKDVAASLSAKDVAVEFVLYQDYRDVHKYAALVARKGWPTPKFIPLGKKSEIDRLVSNRPEQLYSEGYISSELYKNLWSPIEEYVNTGDNIYFAPDGCIYQLAIEQLFDEKGRRLCEKYDMLRCSSTKAVCDKQFNLPYKNAILYGGLKYDEDDETMLEASRNYSISQNNSNGTFQSSITGTTRKGWKYLPGTLKEVTSISGILKKASVDNMVYSSSTGNEESFKSLSGENISILHMATHGFYLTASEAEKNAFVLSNPFSSNQQSRSSSSMERSGLLMSGGNKVWSGGVAPEGVEDGVLTAREISDLNFNSVDLLVLSACETGLGEITNDGVLGLQRAFKNAGVGTIVMSLWEVDDQATSLMMESFYKGLTAGKTKREAFVSAQKAVRMKFEDPRYWAAFIMLD